MRLYPALDIRAGRCVRLAQGDDAQTTVYGDDPVAVAQRWRGAGATRLHVVDLDGSFSGASGNADAIATIVRSGGLRVQLGGGIRSRERAEHWLSLGVDRIVVGTAAVRDPQLVRDLAASYGDQVVVSLDCRDGYVCVDGWTETSDLAATSYVRELEEMGVRHLVYTDIARDGMLQGPNLAELAEITGSTSMSVIASGGVSSEADVRALAALGVAGVIVGKALYEGAVRLEALGEYL